MEVSNTTSFWNVTDLNFTDDDDGVQVPVIKKVHDVIVFFILLTIMFSMGCVITPKQIWENLRYPVGVGVGLLSQFLIMPLTAFVLAKALGVDPFQATGMLVLASSPGGTTSNVLTYMFDGNVALSVTMTTLSTLMALGMMPLNLWIYASHQTGASSGLIIPYSKIGISLAFVTVPIVFGMLCKWKAPGASRIISKAGSYFGLLLIVLIIVLEFVMYPDIFDFITWQLYTCVCLLPIISLCLGYGLAFLFRQQTDVRKTVAIECSVQNVGLSITIISLSFPFKLQKAIIVFSYFYPVPQFTLLAVLLVFYKLWKAKLLSESSSEDNGKVKNGTISEQTSNDALLSPRQNSANT